jgi:succinate dehydrogenase / fumarate reductase cytochrome b subunit
MAIVDRAKSVSAALTYRGREGMWTWILHRATGLGILLFLIVHVVETATVIYWPQLYENFLDTYKSVFFRFAEVLIFFSVVYHALNGTRIIVQDFWPLAMRRQRQLAWAAGGLTVLAMIPITFLMLRPLLGGPEPGEERHRQRIERQQATVPAAAPVMQVTP